MQQPSGNMDDTGFFSVQVISRALTLWNVEMIPLHSSDEYAQHCRDNLTRVRAYILNMESHWFCLRRFSPEDSPLTLWFNLNSLFAKPEFMSSSYLIEYLSQMEKEGYSIFIVKGELPECAADRDPPALAGLKKCISRTTVAGDPSIRQIIDLTKSKSCVSLDENEEDMQKAIELSLQCSQQPSTSFIANSTVHNGTDDQVDADLESALRLSLECFSTQELDCDRRIAETLNTNRMRDKRLTYFESLSPQQK